jgi:hypothetical protein
MDASLREELIPILSAITVTSPESFECAGNTTGTRPEQLLTSLADFLYARCYMQVFAATAPERDGETGDMIPVLRSANPGQPVREFGWRIDQPLEAGYVLARKGGAARRFAPGHYLILDHGFGAPEKDLSLMLCPACESTTVQPSYYYAFGETVNEIQDVFHTIRFYWNVTADGAPVLLATLAARLNRFQIPFQLKLPADRSGYRRRDTAVLYVARRYSSLAATLAADTHGRVVEHLRAETPLFTKRLAHGLAIAEDPQQSFGKSRCLMLAAGLVAAFEKGLTNAEEKLEEVAEQFRRSGLSLDRPYLNAGSRDDYEARSVAP